MSNNPNECPRCDTPLPSTMAPCLESAPCVRDGSRWMCEACGEAPPDVYACQCEEFIYIRPFGERFARWSSILAKVNKLKAADPTIQAQVQASLKRTLE